MGYVSLPEGNEVVRKTFGKFWVSRRKLGGRGHWVIRHDIRHERNFKVGEAL